ncbi:cysteine desulfurase family protein [Canibacter zhoujuaniae]|uniref:cysteine desulfurase family protein n=1 Tax=Canibacter zhoujuaniae TaxID=2708343 RepID=UPI0014228F44|nr:cysteine desulfurase family protein [Canibacter zhoujuaniae]
MRAYFDHAATSPMPLVVRKAFFDALGTVGNPASQHADGQAARDVLESAREILARTLHVTSAEVVFTSGGTESINLALKGLFWARNSGADSRPVILVADGEHHATIDTVEWLVAHTGAEAEWLPLNSDGVLLPEVLEAAITKHGAERIALATVLWANNEIGTIQPVSSLNQICERHGIPLHIDAVSALGYIDISAVHPAALSLSAHKIGGPVSSGALILGRKWQVVPLIHGGSQQRARSGTQDAAAATAFATALELAYQDLDRKHARLQQIQQRLITAIRETDGTAVLRGPEPGEMRLASNVHFTFPGCQGDSLLFLLDMAGVSVSTGSACTAGVAEVSHVMTAIGLDDVSAAGALRFTFSADTTDAEIEMLLTALPQAILQARRAGITAV